MAGSEDDANPRATAQRPAAAGLAALAAIGVAHALWSLFQWTQLVAARTGGRSFCGFSGTDTEVCTAIWDSAFASAVQAYTALPVAGWGLAWSLVAFALPLATLALRAAAADSGEPGERVGAEARLALWPATRLTGLAGLATVIALLVASLLAGGLCTTCALTYALVTGYAVVCLWLTPLRGPGLLRGAYLSGSAVALAFLLLYVPGLRTPLRASDQGTRALEKLAAQRGDTSQAAPGPADPSGAPQPGDPQVEASIRDLLSQFDAELLQGFSDALDMYTRAPSRPRQSPRALIGPADAPVRLTEWSDALCGHCADLHQAIAQIRSALPADSFSIEPRQFPLDSSCNAAVEGESKTPVRCLAARAQICLEGRPDAFDFSGSLFQNQRGLDEDKVYELAARIMPRDELRACIGDESTDEKLQSDIAWAIEHQIRGTPLVLLNGREAPAFPPLLYALILTRGDARHPVFASLPTPQTATH
jgi:serine/threonine-protein kinase